MQHFVVLPFQKRSKLWNVEKMQHLSGLEKNSAFSRF
jgi:hypothetical protein